jgi:hypothetical protein
MIVEDECKINGLQLTELTYNCLSGIPDVQITYALVQADPATKRTVHTHGKVTAVGGNLSAATWDMFRQLISQIEQDLTVRHFKVDVKEKTDETRTTTGSEEADQI